MEQSIPEIDAYVDYEKPYLIARLPYASRDASMYIVFPHWDYDSGKARTTAQEALLSALSNGDLDRFKSGDGIQKMKSETVVLPKFKLKYSHAELAGVLQAMGVEKIFSSGNLIGISPDPRLFVSQVRLDTALEVNEDGSEAAGVASVRMALESARVNHFEFDRPFGLIIRDDRTGLNIFSGVIHDPTPQNLAAATVGKPNSVGSTIRDAINNALFGGQPENRRFADENGSCSVTVVNRKEATEVSIERGGDRKTFIVSELDSTLIDMNRSDYAARNEQRNVFVLGGPSSTASLRVYSGIEGSRKYFVFSIGSGFGFPWTCKVF